MPPTPVGGTAGGSKDAPKGGNSGPTEAQAREIKLRPLTSAIKVAKGNLTRKINKAENVLKVLTTTPLPPFSEHLLNTFSACHTRLTETLLAVEEAYSKIAGADVPENFESYMDKLDEQYARADPLLAQLDDIILQIEDKMSKGAPAPHLAQDPNSHGHSGSRSATRACC